MFIFDTYWKKKNLTNTHPNVLCIFVAQLTAPAHLLLLLACQ